MVKRNDSRSKFNRNEESFLGYIYYITVPRQIHINNIELPRFIFRHEMKPSLKNVSKVFDVYLYAQRTF